MAKMTGNLRLAYFNLRDDVGVNYGNAKHPTARDRKAARNHAKQWQAGTDDALARRDAKNGTKAHAQARMLKAAAFA